MGQTLFEKEGLIVKSLWGGEDRGRCLAFVSTYPIELNAQQVAELVKILDHWLSERKTQASPEPPIS